MKRLQIIANILLTTAVALFCSLLIATAIAEEKQKPELSTQLAIAILPFDNLTSDAKQNQMGAIFTENVVNILSTLPQLLVIVSETMPVQQASKTLDVDYILSAQIQDHGDRLQIAVQLNDTDLDNTEILWTENFTVGLKAALELPSTIAHQVLNQLKIESSAVEQARLTQQSTDNLEAYQLVIAGRATMRQFNKSDNTKAQKLFEKALAIDPKFGLAQVYLGWAYLFQARNRWADNIDQARARAEELAEKVLAADENNIDGLILAAQFHLDKGERAEAIVPLRKAVQLSPSHANAAAMLGINLAYQDNPQQSQRLLEKAIRLNPRPAWYIWALGVAHYVAGEYDLTVTLFEDYSDRNPKDFETQIDLAYAYAQVGRIEAARSAVKKALKQEPSYTVTRWADKFGPRYKNTAVVDSILSNLRNAGLPE